MSIATLLLEVVLAVAGAYGLRQRRHWLFFLAVVAGVVGCFISIGQYVITGEVWWYAIWDLLLAPATLAVVVVALWAAHLTATGLRQPGSGVTSFDGQLFASLAELRDILNEGPEGQDRDSVQPWITQADDRATRVLRRLEGMDAPSGEWKDLLRAYVALTQDTVAAIPKGVSRDEHRRLVARGDELSDRYERLRRSQAQ